MSALTTPEELNSVEIHEEEARIERLMTVREIFEEGYKMGLSQAGLRSDASRAYKDWLLARVERYL